MLNIISEIKKKMSLRKYKITIGTIIQDINIKNKDVLRYVKDWKGEPKNHKYGFKITLDIRKGSKFMKQINQLVTNEVPIYALE